MSALTEFPFRILNRINTITSRTLTPKYESLLSEYDPQLLGAFARIASATNTKSADFILKNGDLLALLRKAGPKHIIELGSGRTSICFAAFAKATGARYAAFEQDERWCKIINDIIEDIYGSRPIVHVPVKEVAIGGRYVRDIPRTADFIYVDGPYVPKDREFGTYTGKPAYVDVVDAVFSGVRPRFIVVDGRTDTVDSIYEKVKEEYSLRGSYIWARQRHNWATASFSVATRFFKALTSRVKLLSG